jgi:hypothetical protein
MFRGRVVDMKVKDYTNILPDGSVYLDVGPMQMRISVWQGERSAAGLSLAGAEKACSQLEELGENKEIINSSILAVRTRRALPRVVNRMIESVQRMNDPSMTPLAAVAGAVADEVADFICTLERVSRVIVNNGGDIALRLHEGAVARIGVQEDLSFKEFSHLLSVKDCSGIGGVATSGVGGRSFTKGIASAVMIAAPNAAIADAAATCVANSVNVESPGIVRAQAEEIDPDTDIAGQRVTVSVGYLSDKEVEEALSAGMREAEQLRLRGLITGALMALKGKVIVSEGLRPMISQASSRGKPRLP